MSWQDFTAAIKAEARPPCERYSCINRSACANGEACDAFVHYVRTGEVVPPTAAFYGNDKMLWQGRVAHWTERIQATPQKFTAVMREDAL